jgi:TolB-like protein/Tfp pilus assembly protein PilF
MITVRLPFDGVTPEEIARRRLTEPPHRARTFSPQLPVRFERALMRCLDRNPSKRFPTAATFVDAIASGHTAIARLNWWVKAALVAALCLAPAVAWQPAQVWILRIIRPAVQDRSVAVLPFQKLGNTPEFFSDGFTEELIHALGQVRGIRLLGPESSFHFKSSNLSPREIGNKLGVHYLLTGSVGRLEKDIRVIARLIDTRDGAQLWSRAVTRNEQDVFLLRDDIARMVAGEFRLSLAGMDVAAQTIDPSGLSARDLYWTGRLYFRQRSDLGVMSSLEYFRQAVARDPAFALGYCGLADALFVAAERDLLPPDQALAEASQTAHRAVTLDSRLPDAWVSLAQLTSIYDHNLDEADRLFRHALQLDPRSAPAWQWYSYQLVKQRRFANAISAGEAAVAADPLSIPANINLAVVYLYSGADDRAVQQCRKLTQMDPQLFFEHPMVALVFGRKGLFGEALHEMEQIPETRRNHRITLRVWVEIYALAGMRDQAKQALTRLLEEYARGGIPASYVAAGYAAVGDRDNAVEWLGRALAARDAFASVANAYPAFDSVRSDPRYIALMEQLGIRAQTGSGSTGRQ